MKKARDQNLALLTKLDWNLTFKDGSFWVDIIRDKTWENTIFCLGPERVLRSASYTWRSIISSSEVLRKGIKWVIGDGKLVDIWNDRWCEASPQATIYPSNHTDTNDKVNTLISCQSLYLERRLIKFFFAIKKKLWIPSLWMGVGAWTTLLLLWRTVPLKPFLIFGSLDSSKLLITQLGVAPPWEFLDFSCLWHDQYGGHGH